MFFFISPIGLGHVARDVAIIDHLKPKNNVDDDDKKKTFLGSTYISLAYYHIATFSNSSTP